MPRKRNAPKTAAPAPKKKAAAPAKPAEKVEKAKPAPKKDAKILKLPNGDPKAAERLKELQAEKEELQTALKNRVDAADKALNDYLKSEGLVRVARLFRGDLDEVCEIFEEQEDREHIDIQILYVHGSS